MFTASEVEIRLTDVDHPVVLMEARTPVGVVEIIGRITIEGRVLHALAVHIGGLEANAIGIAGLNAIAQRVLEEADVDQIIVEGGVRTTGRGLGKRPRP